MTIASPLNYCAIVNSQIWIVQEVNSVRFRNWLQRVMSGRYGPDQLNTAMLILAIILSITASLTGLGILSTLVYVLLILAILRLMSRNIYARRKENDRFLKYWWPIRTKVKNLFDKDYKFLKCPECKCTLRVPKGKGTIQITCPKCGERFIKKT